MRTMSLTLLLAGIQDIPELDIPFGSVDIGSSEFRDYFTFQTCHDPRSATRGKSNRLNRPGGTSWQLCPDR